MKIKVLKVPRFDTIYEPITGRYFKCTHKKLMRHVYIFNIKRKIAKNNRIRLNAWFEQIGLPGIEIGDLLVWPSWKDVGYIGIQCELKFSASDTPVIVLVYEVDPIYNL